MEAEREMEQELEWREAQKIVTSLDLLAAAKTQLEFLAAVDKNRWLYEGSTLEKSIYRYKACWLPLLAKHAESQIPESPLVVPLDCEWVWHCHRLNPVRYKTDCEELYGKILDNTDVVSSIKGISTAHTEEIWNRLYPDEPYHFDFSRLCSNTSNKKLSQLEKSTTYDLVSAVKRQSPFYYQVSRPQFSNDVFLEDAVARYKGFLYLIKKNTEKSIKCFSVPTYDIDLIWHTHQLHPVFYCKDLTQAVGKILEHDDMDSDRTKGKKLDVGFVGTIRRWQETFGTRYRKAGAMYRGTAPSPVTAIPFASNILSKDVAKLSKYEKMIQIPELKIVEVLLQIVGVKNLPKGHKGNLFVAFSKKQPDAIFNVKQNLTIMSESGDKHITSFHCEPTGDLFFELVSHSPSNLPVTKSVKTLGTYSLSLQDLLNPLSKLTEEKWVELQCDSGNLTSKPICLRVAISFGVPVQGTRVFHMHHPPSLLKSCFLPLSGMVQHDKNCTRIVDQTHADVISLRMRDSTTVKGKDESILKNQVVGVMKSGETHTLAQFVGTRWSLLDSEWFLQFKSKSSENGHLFDLVGSRMVKIFLGRKLDFEPKHCEKRRSEQDFMTAVEFSAEDPFGKAVALLDLKSGIIKVKEALLLLPVIISAFIVSKTLKKKGYEGFNVNEEYLEEVDSAAEKVDKSNEDSNQANLTTSAQLELGLNENMTKANVAKGGGCGGGGCGNMMESGGCGSGCGGGCGSMMKSGGCGSGCGGGCGSMMNSGGCGSGCGGGCGSMMKSGGCGSGCGGGCGSMMNSGGCGSGCGGGCGSMINSSGCGGCGGGCGGDMEKSGGCGSGCAGGCGSMINSSGCGGCGGGCGDRWTAETANGAGEGFASIVCSNEAVHA